MKNKVYFTLVIALFVQFAFAQEKTVSGTVTDDTGPIPGAIVYVEGGSSATTDFDGKYSIEASEGDVLNFQYVGYKSRTVKVGTSDTYNTTFQGDNQLEEVLVVGYGTVRKSDATGSVVAVKGEDLLDRPVTSVVGGLSGKVAGVNVSTNSGAPGATPRIRIRGSGSIGSSNEPLYVVDGVIGVGGIGFLNPNDIKSLEVLKDASATSIYGARGANGVIIITTKRGRTDGRVTVGYNGYVSVSVMQNKLDVLSGPEFWQILKTGVDNAKLRDPDFDKVDYNVIVANNPDFFDSSGNPIYDTDWQDEATRTAFSQNHQVSVQGGDTKNSYGIFVGNTNQNGIFNNTYFKRNSLKFVDDIQINERIKFGGNISINDTEERVIEQGGGNNTIRTIIEAVPIIPVKHKDGTWGSPRQISDANFEGTNNPVQYLEDVSKINENDGVLSNLYAEFKLAEGLKLRSSYGIDTRIRKRSEYDAKTLNNATHKGEAGLFYEKTAYWQQENYVTWDKEFDENNRINTVGGLSWQKRTNSSFQAQADDFSDDVLKWNALESATSPRAPSSGADEWSLNSYFVRSNYILKDKYLFTGTGRLDGSSRFGANNKFAFFPSGAFAWVLSKEEFANGLTWLDNLKLRTSYGVTGNTEIGSYRSLSTLNSGNGAVFNDSRATYAYPGSFANPDLQWEKTYQTDIGIDGAIFAGLLSFEIDYYSKVTKDLILSAPVPNSTGFTSVLKNIGSVSNKGIDVSLTTRNVRTDDFSWSTTFIYNYNKNEILALGENDEDIFADGWVGGSSTILRVGESVNTFWGYKREGIYTAATATGASGEFEGDIIRSAEKSILGKGVPDGTGSFVNNFKYKRIELSVDLQFSHGLDVVKRINHSAEDRTSQANSLASVLDAWEPGDPASKSDIALTRVSAAPYYTFLDDKWVEDADFLRIRNVVLSYNFLPESLGGKIENLKIYLSGDNLAVFTKYTGSDPEVRAWGSEFSQGLDFYSYPKATTYTFGINLTF